MKKKILSLIVGSIMLVPTLSSAVGLGSVRTYSGLNEHLRAEIPVLSVKTREDMQVNLAPNSVFAQSGVSRTKVIDDLRFFLVERNGRIYVRVKSSKQVNVPYLNFILQLKSAEGVVSREYAIFLDPQKPGKRKAKMPAAKPLSKYSKRKHSNAVRPVPVTQQKVDNVHQIKNIETSNLSAGKYGPVRKGETLWSIASHVRPSEAISVRKMLKLLKKSNRKTLSRGLPVGAILNVPTIEGYPQYQGGYAVIPNSVKKKQTTKKSLKPKMVTELHSDMKSKAMNHSKDVTTSVNDADNIISEKQSYPKVEKKKEVNDLDQENSLRNKASGEVLISEALPADNVQIPQANNEIGDVVTTEPTTTEPTTTEPTTTEPTTTEPTTTEPKSSAVSESSLQVPDVLKEAPVGEEDITEKLKETSETDSAQSEKLDSSTSDEMLDESHKEVVNSKPVEKTNEASKATVVSESTNQSAETGVSKKAPKTNASVENTTESDDSEFPLIPVLGGFTVLAGLGAFLFSRRKPKATEEGAVILLDDEDFFDDTEGEADIDTPLISFDDENPSEMSIETNLSDTDTIVDDAELNNSDELVEDVLLDLEAENDFDVNETAVISDELDLLLDEAQNEMEEAENLLVEGIEGSSVETSDDNESLDEAFDFEGDFDFDDELSNLSGEDPKTADVAATSDKSDSPMEFNLSVDEPSTDIEASEHIETESLTSEFITEEFSTDFDLTDDAVSASSNTEELLDFDLSDFENTNSDDEPLDLLVDLDSTIDNHTDDLKDSYNELESFGLDLDSTDDVVSELTDPHTELEGLSIDLDTADDINNFSVESDSSDSKQSDMQIDFEDELSLDTSLETKEEAELVTESLDLSDVADPEPEHREVSEDVSSSVQLKLDLATSFVSISNNDRARELLEDVVKDGSDEQVAKAKSLLSQLN